MTTTTTICGDCGNVEDPSGGCATCSEVLCPSCDGHGEHLMHQQPDGLLVTDLCAPCQGDGTVTVQERVDYLTATEPTVGCQTPEQAAANDLWTFDLTPTGGWNAVEPF